MFDSREFGPFNSIESYDHVSPNSSEPLKTPFAVAVFTLEYDFLGLGSVIGRLKRGNVEEPVIQVKDTSSPFGTVEFMDCECNWALPTPEISAILPESVAVSAHTYAQEIDIQRGEESKLN
jgi:hypothetical protein